jgi:hypothetical protein
MLKDSSGDGSPPKMDLTKLSDRLTLYIIATCYPKILRRLESKLSTSYINSLTQLSDIQFGQFQYEPPSKAEIENDRLFLVNFLAPTAADSRIQTQIPSILEQANLAEKGKDFQLYTATTCMEFHALFCELLLRFLQNLQALRIFRGNEDPPHDGCSEFKQRLFAVMYDGGALQKLAKGAALRMHLTNIEASLDQPKANETSRETQDERDEDLEAVQPFAKSVGKPMPLWKSYRDWLRLMIVHFDAVDILVGFATSPQFHYKTISLQVVVPPTVNNELLPWRDLFAKPEFFPTGNTQDPFSNNDILKFLESGVKASSPNYGKWAREARRFWVTREVDATIMNTDKLKKSALPGWPSCVEKLLANLKDWKSQEHPSEFLSREITNLIQSLCDSSTLFSSLAKGLKFLGTLHCEACLASLLQDFLKDIAIDSKFEDILARMKVTYVASGFCHQILI